MKRLMIMAMIALGAGTLTGCVAYPDDVVVVRHSGYYYPERGYYRERVYYRERPYYRGSRYYVPRYSGGYHRRHHHYW